MQYLNDNENLLKSMIGLKIRIFSHTQKKEYWKLSTVNRSFNVLNCTFVWGKHQRSFWDLMIKTPTVKIHSTWEPLNKFINRDVLMGLQPMIDPRIQKKQKNYRKLKSSNEIPSASFVTSSSPKCFQTGSTNTIDNLNQVIAKNTHKSILIQHHLRNLIHQSSTNAMGEHDFMTRVVDIISHYSDSQSFAFFPEGQIEFLRYTLPPEYPEQIMFMRKPVSENRRSFTQTHRNNQKQIQRHNHPSETNASRFPDNDDEFQQALQISYDYIEHITANEQCKYLPWPVFV